MFSVWRRGRVFTHKILKTAWDLYFTSCCADTVRDNSLFFFYFDFDLHLDRDLNCNLIFKRLYTWTFSIQYRRLFLKNDSTSKIIYNTLNMNGRDTKQYSSS
jgi:hypothetical protein